MNTTTTHTADLGSYMTTALTRALPKAYTVTPLSSAEQVAEVRQYRGDEFRSSGLFRVEELGLAFDVVIDWGAVDPGAVDLAAAPPCTAHPVVLYQAFFPEAGETTLVPAINRAQAYKQQLIAEGVIKDPKRRSWLSRVLGR